MSEDLEAQSASAGKVMQNNWVLGRFVVTALVSIESHIEKK